ncbi:hypothetical protein RHSIM_Rhsim04G0099300 [Rhododendron simsii]|uniref:CCR4-NOT transcription complex subunit 1 CAF1-binding domain-containing protein n=1 Tax=Rhododendron simsii TaxID=118357 RepID=A0A834H4E6_RHOSS|nr:hypothetical protein RHSIM_Rhsim04G0099300 [Rhododendron simsii]
MEQLRNIIIQDVQNSLAIMLMVLGVVEQATRHSIGCEGFLGWWPREDESIPSGTSVDYNELFKLLLQKQPHDVTSLATHILHRLRHYVDDESIPSGTSVDYNELFKLLLQKQPHDVAFLATHILHRLRLYEVASRYESSVLSALASLSTSERVTNAIVDKLTSARFQLKTLMLCLIELLKILSEICIELLQGMCPREAIVSFVSCTVIIYLAVSNGNVVDIFVDIASYLEAVILSVLFCRSGLIFLHHPELSTNVILALRGSDGLKKEEPLPLRYASVLISKGFVCQPEEIGMIVEKHLRVVNAIDCLLTSDAHSEEILWVLWELCALSRSHCGQQALLALGIFQRGNGLLQYIALLASGGDPHMASTSILLADTMDVENMVGDSSTNSDSNLIENLLEKPIFENSYRAAVLRDSSVAQMTTAFRILAFISGNSTVATALYDESAVMVIHAVLIDFRLMLERSSNNYNYLVGEGTEGNSTSDLLLERTREQGLVDLVIPSFVLLVNLLQKLQQCAWIDDLIIGYYGLMPGPSFPLIGSVGAQPGPHISSSILLQQKHQIRLDDSDSFGSLLKVQPQSSASVSSVLSSSTGFTRPSRAITSARFGCALNIEALVAAAERRETPLESDCDNDLLSLNFRYLSDDIVALDIKVRRLQHQRFRPASEIQDKISFIINNLSSTNFEAKAKEFSEILTEQYYSWFAQYMVMKRASIEPNFHDLYLKFIDKVNLKPLNKRLYRPLMRTARFLPSTDLVLESPPPPPLTTANNHQLLPTPAPKASVATANHQIADDAQGRGILKELETDDIDTSFLVYNGLKALEGQAKSKNGREKLEDVKILQFQLFV